MDYLSDEYDVIVIGAGHAGVEAALASSRLGKKVAIFVINLDTLANMPCNPSIGGTSKGHLVKEIDVLGGAMGKIADKTFIQSKMLNTSKGPAVYSLRMQIDRKKYHIFMKQYIENDKNIDIYQAEITDILVKDKKIVGVKTKIGAIFNSKCVIVSTGTYLKGKIIIGEVSYESGPDGVFPANELSKSLTNLGIELRRFKTGTPARINVNNIDLSKMEIQYGDKKVSLFTSEKKITKKDQVPCYLTYTNKNTHEIINKNIDRSPLYNGSVHSIGPRYCPSIEDKVMRFADKQRHQIFIEPMGLDTNEMYIQGMSSSMPEEIQIQIYRSIKGLENAKMMRSAYAIEYDVINSTNLKLSLEYKDIDGLFFAGQINGSSGYEEAAAQGLIAGINAALKIDKKEPFILDRSESYIGVLIDDLVTKGTNEPYRMMTSRAEYRLLLRQDNTDLRLKEKAYKFNLISYENYSNYKNKEKIINEEIDRFKKLNIYPTDENNKILKRLKSSQIDKVYKASELIKRTEIKYKDIEKMDKKVNLPDDIKEQVEINLKYEGYIKLQLNQINEFKKLENKKLSQDIDYSLIKGLSLEARQKLNKVKPISIGQASRISGVSPADISVILIFLASKK
ncbi:MAG: tRNA uridine-5-carboxymethylaminomethyl(34) synthesis enzyme MnmG [Clostridia bacterium]